MDFNVIEDLSVRKSINCASAHQNQARSGVLGIRYLGPFYFRYMVFFGQNPGIKYLVFPEF